MRKKSVLIVLVILVIGVVGTGLSAIYETRMATYRNNSRKW